MTKRMVVIMQLKNIDCQEKKNLDGESHPGVCFSTERLKGVAWEGGTRYPQTQSQEEGGVRQGGDGSQHDKKLMSHSNRHLCVSGIFRL